MALTDEFISELNTAVEAVRPVAADVVATAAETPVVETPFVSETTNVAVVPEVETVVIETPITPVAPVATVAPVVPEKVAVVFSASDELIERAIRSGLSYGDVRSFTNEGALLRVIGSIESARVPVVKHESEQKKVASILDTLPALDAEAFEPEVVRMYDSLVDVIKKQDEKISRLEASHADAQVSRQLNDAQEVEQWFDSQVAKLGDDFSADLGKGGYSSLSEGSVEKNTRDALANQVAVLMAGYRASGQQQPSREDIFDSAAQLVLRDTYQKAQENRLSADLVKRSSQHIQRAGSVVGKTKSDPLVDVAAMIDQKYFGKS